MSFVVMELKPAEVEYLNSMWRCRSCDHLGALHNLRQWNPWDDPEDESLADITWCRIDGCRCQEFH